MRVSSFVKLMQQPSIAYLVLRPLVWDQDNTSQTRTSDAIYQGQVQKKIESMPSKHICRNSGVPKGSKPWWSKLVRTGSERDISAQLMAHNYPVCLSTFILDTEQDPRLKKPKDEVEFVEARLWPI